MSSPRPNFQHDGRKRILCPACKGFIRQVALYDKFEEYEERCDNCHSAMLMCPPERFIDEAGNKMIAYGPGNACFTADYTEEEAQ